MSTDIKKKSASHIYYGKDQETGKLRYISQVPSGLQCNCRCLSCGKPLEARKGTLRQHHFAHVSNYDCMYAGEIAVYYAFAAALRERGKICFPAVTLRFSTWRDAEVISLAQTMDVDEVFCKCGASTYPPVLQIAVKGKLLRVILDFDHYYNEKDSARLSADAQRGGYSILRYQMSALDEDRFSMERLAHMIENGKQADWMFNMFEARQKERFYREAQIPQKRENGCHCPISAAGKYYAKLEDCAQCECNVAEPPDCLCTAGAGIRRWADFKRSGAQRKARIEELRRKNEAEIQRRQRKFELAKTEYSTFKSATKAEPLKQSTPTAEELELEHMRIVSDFDPDVGEQICDKFGRRWVKCKYCGQIKQIEQMTSYGGPHSLNLGKCRECSRKGLF